MPLRLKKFFIILVGVALVANGALFGAARAEELTYLEQQSSGVGEKSALELINCGSIWNNLSMSCIMPMAAYYLFYIPAVGVLTLSGYIFDFMMALSIDKAFIEQPFVNTAWVIVRDFSNMIFIFILLFTGIQTIFGLGNWQHTVMQIVVIALLVNFSMFFAKVIIDAGNILAVGMYQSIGSEKLQADRPHKRSGQTVEERNITASLVNAFAPQKFMSLASADKSYATTIFIIAAIVSGWVAYVFFRAAFLFMGRVIAFWFLIIISPFALVSMTLPKGNIWGWWYSTLIDQAFVAPIFLFFIYLIMMAVQGGTSGNGILAGLGEPTSGNFFFDAIFIPIVITGMIIFALKKALGIATSMSDDFGKIGADLGNKALGLAGVVATGGASATLGAGAMAARATVGQGAGKFLASRTLQEMGTRTGFKGFFGRGLMGVADRAHTGSFDIRETGITQRGIKAAGIDVGKAGGKGGFEAEQKRREKEDKARAEKYELTDAEKKKMAPGYDTAKKTKEGAGEEKKGAEKAHKEARERSDSSATGQRVSAAEKNLKEKQVSAAKMSGDALVKKVEAVNKKQAEAVTDEQKEAAAKELEQVQKEAERAERELQGAVAEFEEATKTHETTDAGKALAAASQELNKVTTTLEEAERIVKDSEAKFKAENERRRERIGQVQTFTRLYLTPGDREVAVKKIREGTSKDKKKREDFIKTLRESIEEKEKPKEEGGEKK